MSKWGPAAGDVGVIGVLAFINRNAVGSCAFFFPNVTANGYDSAAQNIEDSLGVEMPKFTAKNIPDGINDGDWVMVTIAQSTNGVLFATDIEAL